MGPSEECPAAEANNSAIVKRVFLVRFGKFFAHEADDLVRVRAWVWWQLLMLERMSGLAVAVSKSRSRIRHC